MTIWAGAMVEWWKLIVNSLSIAAGLLSKGKSCERNSLDGKSTRKRKQWKIVRENETWRDFMIVIFSHFQFGWMADTLVSRSKGNSCFAVKNFRRTFWRHRAYSHLTTSWWQSTGDTRRRRYHPATYKLNRNRFDWQCWRYDRPIEAPATAQRSELNRANPESRLVWVLLDLMIIL